MSFAWYGQFMSIWYLQQCLYLTISRTGGDQVTCVPCKSWVRRWGWSWFHETLYGTFPSWYIPVGTEAAHPLPHVMNAEMHRIAGLRVVKGWKVDSILGTMTILLSSKKHHGVLSADFATHRAHHWLDWCNPCEFQSLGCPCQRCVAVLNEHVKLWMGILITCWGAPYMVTKKPPIPIRVLHDTFSLVQWGTRPVL